jgi:serine protease Do
MGRRLSCLSRAQALCAALLCSLLASCSAGTNSATANSSADSLRIHLVESFNAPELETRFEQVAAHASSSVVAISATEDPFDADLGADADDINPAKLAGLLETVDRTVGTGFIFDSDGYIVTNDHVIAKAQQLWVTTDSHKVYPAIVVSSDPRADLAVLKIPATHLPVAKFASKPVARGQWTLSIGNPYGIASSGGMAVSVGIVSATNRSLPRLSGKEDRLYSNLIQTTAQINPGNSGGPLFDLRGEVIGITTAVILPQKQTNGIGFAIPVDSQVTRLLNDLKQGKEPVHGYLGVSVTSATTRQLRDCGLDGDCGARIESLDLHSPAAIAGLREGDIIAELDGQRVLDSDEFVRLVGLCPVDTPVTATVYRDGPTHVLLQLRPRKPRRGETAAATARVRWHGMLIGAMPTYWDFTPGKRPSCGVMVIGVDAKAVPAGLHVRPGSVITAVEGQPVHDVSDLRRFIAGDPTRQCHVQLSDCPETALVSARD